MTEFTIYTMKSCPYCEKAKRILKTNNISFKEILVDYDDDSMWDMLFKKSGLKTVPQIFCGDELIGGCGDLEKLEASGELKTRGE